LAENGDDFGKRSTLGCCGRRSQVPTKREGEVWDRGMMRSGRGREYWVRKGGEVSQGCAGQCRAVEEEREEESGVAETGRRGDGECLSVWVMGGRRWVLR
jgi:hypothetical protein